MNMSPEAIQAIVRQNRELLNEIRSMQNKTTPAKFRRITKRTRINSPCVMIDMNTSPIVATVYRVTEHGDQMKGGYTHYLPIQFPEARG